MEKIIKLILCGLSIFALSAFAAPVPKIKSASALVVDAETNFVLFSKNEDDVRPIASITKLMTAVIAVESGVSLDEEITIIPEDNDKVTRSFTRLKFGTTLPRRDILQIALMASDNRAAKALARTTFGDLPTFVEKMNQKAAELGMTSTTYYDPTGLYSANESTAEDLAKLVQYASSIPEIKEASTSTTYELPYTVYVKKRGKQQAIQYFRSTNKLIMKDKWDVEVQKTGYITRAGNCVVMLTDIAGRKIIIVLLNAVSSTARFNDARMIKSTILKGIW